MFGKKKFNKNRKIILDIGTQYVKIVDMLIAKHEAKLNSYRILNLVQGGKRFIGKEISKIIKKSLLDMKINENLIYTSISGKSVIVRFMDMPAMSQKELKNSLRYQSDLRLPFDLNEALVDIQIINPKSEAEGKMKVVVAAVPKKEAEKILDIIKGATLACLKIDVDAIAIANAFEWGRVKEDEEVVALVNIGAARTNLSIVNRGMPVLCRELNYGGINITETISQNLEIGFDEAEEKKIKGDSSIMNIMEEALKPISIGLMQSFDFYEGSSGVHIPKIFLSGGGAEIRGIIDFLKATFNRNVVIWNPLRSIDFSAIEDKELLQSNSPILAVALGIGLGEM